MISDEMTIILSDEDGALTVDALQKSLENALAMLRAVQAQVVATGIKVTWEVVHVQMQSPLRLTMRANVQKNGRRNKAIGQKIVNRVMTGVEGIEFGRSLPNEFTHEAIEAARAMLKCVSEEGARMQFAAPNRSEVSITKNSLEHIESILLSESSHQEASSYHDYSTIEGRLEVVSIHDRLTCSVYDSLTNHKVDCHLPESRMDEVKALLGKRVSISGLVSYRNHIPKTLKVEGEIRILRDSSQRTCLDAIPPLNLTNGVDSDIFVGELRHA